MGQSRNEDILQSIVDATQYTDPPKSRVEDLLLQVKEAIEEGGGGGGTSNYNDLSNKPQIGGVTLSGNKSASDLSLATTADLAGKVDKVEGKGLSTNDYTDADKAIVGGVTAALADKVDKVEGKGLSTNDFTDAYKTAIGANTTAISGIKDGASINSFGGVETALADKADKSAVKNEFIGTTAEWNALTTAQKKAYDTYQITDDYTEGSGGLPDYSTTEQKTGQKWIDGKDVYCKVYNNIQLSGNTDITVDNNLIHDSIVRINATVKDISGADTYITPFQSFGTLNNIGAIPRVINNRLSINCVGIVSGTATIIIEYTKA